jgi:hypothetical protein
MAKKKKKDTKLPEPIRILEYKGWSAGDRCYTVFLGETKPSLCDILYFHPDDNISPAVCVTDIVTGKYRVAAVRSISETAKGAQDLKPKWEKYLAKQKTKK